MIILSVDPGDRTGLALYDTATNAFHSWEMEPIDFMLQDVYPYISHGDVDLVICEDFIIHADTPKMKKPLRWPLEMKGAIRWMCLKHKMKLVIQTPSQKDWMDDDKLQHIGWYKGTKAKNATAGHSDDAARHIGVYLGVTRQDREFLRRLL